MNSFESGTFPLQYRIMNKVLYLRGRIKTVTTKSGVSAQFGKIPVTLSSQYEWVGVIIGTAVTVRLMISTDGALSLAPTADMGNAFQISGFNNNFLLD